MYSFHDVDKKNYWLLLAEELLSRAALKVVSLVPRILIGARGSWIFIVCEADFPIIHPCKRGESIDVWHTSSTEILTER